MKLEGEQGRMNAEQAQEQRQLDVLAYHQSVNASESEAKVCVAFDSLKNISWEESGDELRDALKRLYEDNDKDCYVSISEYRSEKQDEWHVERVKIFYVKLHKTEKFNPSTSEEGKNIILEHCRNHDVPIPSLIIYDGNEYVLKWLLREPLEAVYLSLWKHIQEHLACKFFYVLYNLMLGTDESKKYVEAHKNATVMLRVPGFLNSETPGVDLFHPKQEVRIIFSSERRYSVGEIARELRLRKSEIERYREIKAYCGGYKQKLAKKSKQAGENFSEVTAFQPAQEDLITAVLANLQKLYEAGQDETHIYYQWKNPNKHERTDRSMYYASCLTGNIDALAERLARAECDYWTSAAEYKIPLRPKNKTREREVDGKTRVERVLKVPKNEKWVEVIRLNFLLIDFRKSELGYMPTPEQARELIYARCRKIGIPYPEIIDVGDEFTTFELRWYWQDKICNDERESFEKRYPGFNAKFKGMQEKLFCLFWDLGASEKKLNANTMLNVPGTLNTKTGRRRQILAKASERLTSSEMDKRLTDALSKREPAKPEQADHEALTKRTASEIRGTMERFIKSSTSAPSPSMLKLLGELAEYTDFELLYEKKNEALPRQGSMKLSTQMRLKKTPYYEGERGEWGGEDLRRLHSGECESGRNWMCVCIESGGIWSEYWCRVGEVWDKLSELQNEYAGFRDCNVYVSQLEFGRSKRSVEVTVDGVKRVNVAAFSVCFVDIDGKIAGHENMSAEEWKCLVLEFCRLKGIPVPSEIVFTGNGVHVKYFFKCPVSVVSDEVLRLWERLEKMLYELFKEIGADSKATDAARVLRLVGSRNCKPETKDRDVLIVHSGDSYDYEEFAAVIASLVSGVADDVSECVQLSQTEQHGKHAKTQTAPPISSTSASPVAPDADSCENNSADRSVVEAVPVLEGESLFVNNKTLGRSGWISPFNLSRYLKSLDHSHEVECSIVSYRNGKRQDRDVSIENIYLNYVILENCPGRDFNEQLENIRLRCQRYRGVGIPEPNRILRDGNRLILLWRFSKESSGQELPGCALPRWKVVQELLAQYFEPFGAVSYKIAVKSTTLLPVTGFKGASGEVVERVYHAPAVQYLFDTLARAVLPFSQAQVEAYKEWKKANPSKRILELEDLALEYVLRRGELGQRSKFNPALKIFNDIVKLIRLRKDSDGEVPQGYRELCVFYAMNFAIQAGLIREYDSSDFNELALKLIALCGHRFETECCEKTFVTLREKFMNGELVYRARNRKIINDLGITPEEQAELQILKEKVKPAKQEKKKKTPIWDILGVSKATYYRHEKERREAFAALLRLYVSLRSLMLIAQMMSNMNFVLSNGLSLKCCQILIILRIRLNSLKNIRPPPEQ